MVPRAWGHHKPATRAPAGSTDLAGTAEFGGSSHFGRVEVGSTWVSGSSESQSIESVSMEVRVVPVGFTSEHRRRLFPVIDSVVVGSLGSVGIGPVDIACAGVLVGRLGSVGIGPVDIACAGVLVGLVRVGFGVDVVRDSQIGTREIRVRDVAVGSAVARTRGIGRTGGATPVANSVVGTVIAVIDGAGIASRAVCARTAVTIAAVAKAGSSSPAAWSSSSSTQETWQPLLTRPNSTSTNASARRCCTVRGSSGAAAAANAVNT